MFFISSASPIRAPLFTETFHAVINREMERERRYSERNIVKETERVGEKERDIEKQRVIQDSIRNSCIYRQNMERVTIKSYKI